MLFNHRLHAGIRNGSITLTIRRWSRPQARVGGHYRLDAAGVVEVTGITMVDAAAITDRLARACGAPDRGALLKELARYGGPMTASEQLYRIEFRYVATADPRIALREEAVLSAEEVRELKQRLARLDARSPDGPWTMQTLLLIKDRPRVLAAELAAACGRERLPFKADVRRLKALGLTISHEVGYELSPRGMALLQQISGR